MYYYSRNNSKKEKLIKNIFKNPRKITIINNVIKKIHKIHFKISENGLSG